MVEETEKKNKQMLEEREKSYQEHIKQLTEKMKKKHKQKMADQEWVLTTKLEVFTLVIAILCFTALNQKHCLEGRALCQMKDFSS